MLNKNLINKFNKRNNLIIISEYLPLQKASTGLAWYTLNAQKSISKVRKIVITNRTGDKDELYQDKNTLVIRCFQKKNPLSLFTIVSYVVKFDQLKNTLFEFEFASYGNVFSVLLIPFVLLLLKILGKRVYFSLHQVVNNLKSLHSHIGISKNSLILPTLNFGLNIFYLSIGLFSEKIIVLEEEFKQRIIKYVNKDKVVFVPIGIKKFSTKTNVNLKNKMNLKKNDFIILVFGYIAWYKGIDRLIDSFNKISANLKGRKLKLIIAGGYSQAQAGRSHYEKYYQSIKSKVKENKRIALTGFVPENKIVDYYSAADLCIVPYREFISSSGPLSLALSFRKAVVLSRELKNYMKSSDFNMAMKSAKLEKNDLFINIDHDSLKNTIIRLMVNKNFQKKLINFSIKLSKFRNWKKIGQYHSEIITKDKKVAFSLPKLNFSFGKKNYKLLVS